MTVGLMAVIVDYLGGTVSGIPLQWEAHRAVQRAVTILRGGMCAIRNQSIVIGGKTSRAHFRWTLHLTASKRA